MRRPITRFRAGLEPLEGKQLPSVGQPTVAAEKPPTGLDALVQHSVAPERQFTLFRITNTAFPNTVNLKPPFQQVLVQARQPVPGEVYNVLSLALRNGTAETFDSSSGLTVRLSTSGAARPLSFPILTGNAQWKPGQFIVFYVLSKKYYPVNPVVSGGFTFNFTHGSVAIPGPSGIFLRLKYEPARFARTLDYIVAYGPGAEGGKGAQLGLPDTAIWEFVSPRTKVIPL
jgi:hypothetical protein